MYAQTCSTPAFSKLIQQNNHYISLASIFFFGMFVLSFLGNYTQTSRFVKIFLDASTKIIILFTTLIGEYMSKTARSISLDDEDWEILESYGAAFGQSVSNAIGSIVRQPKVYLDWIATGCGEIGIKKLP
jgi:hypothetical protein